MLARVKCLVLARGARRDKALDEVSAAILGDAQRRREPKHQGRAEALRAGTTFYAYCTDVPRPLNALVRKKCPMSRADPISFSITSQGL
jgi:hypothetical protein